MNKKFLPITIFAVILVFFVIFSYAQKEKKLGVAVFPLSSVGAGVGTLGESLTPTLTNLLPKAAGGRI